VAVDASELRALIADLREAPQLVRREARAVISKGALNIKDQMRDEVAKSRHFRFAHTVSYDLKVAGDTIEAEIGPETGGVGSLAGFAYFGGVNGGGGTVPDPQGALDAEAPNVEKYLAELAEKALW
jgi:hypothetical protein